MIRVRTAGTARYQTEYGYLRFGYYSDHPVGHPYDNYVSAQAKVRYKTYEETGATVNSIQIRFYIERTSGNYWTGYYTYDESTSYTTKTISCSGENRIS